MLLLTVDEMRAVTGPLAVTVVAVTLAAAWYLWRQERDVRALRADLEALEDDVDRLWAWCMAAAAALGWDDDDPSGPPGDPGPGPADDDPDTAVAHPADTWARKQALLHRYTHHGQHRG